MSRNSRTLTSCIAIVFVTLLPALSQESSRKPQPIQKRRAISRSDISPDQPRKGEPANRLVTINLKARWVNNWQSNSSGQ